MNITKDQEEIIINCGAFNYDIDKMSNITGLDAELIRLELLDNSSLLSRLYKKGIDLSDYVIDLKLLELAKVGDIKAIDKFESRKKERALTH